MGPHHELYGLAVRALAVAIDQDDVLFEIDETGKDRYAIVHLTWSGKTEPSPTFPGTQFFDSLADWMEKMKRDHEDYTFNREIDNL